MNTGAIWPRNMDAEERWTNRLFEKDCEQRGFNHEINQITEITDKHESCHMGKCQLPAVKRYEIKRVGEPGAGWFVQLCIDHDSEENAWEVYREYNA